MIELLVWIPRTTKWLQKLCQRLQKWLATKSAFCLATEYCFDSSQFQHIFALIFLLLISFCSFPHHHGTSFFLYYCDCTFWSLKDAVPSRFLTYQSGLCRHLRQMQKVSYAEWSKQRVLLFLHQCLGSSFELENRFKLFTQENCSWPLGWMLIGNMVISVAMKWENINRDVLF